VTSDGKNVLHATVGNKSTPTLHCMEIFERSKTIYGMNSAGQAYETSTLDVDLWMKFRLLHLSSFYLLVFGFRGV